MIVLACYDIHIFITWSQDMHLAGDGVRIHLGSENCSAYLIVWILGKLTPWSVADRFHLMEIFSDACSGKMLDHEKMTD